MLRSRKKVHAPQQTVVEQMADIDSQSRPQIKVLIFPAGNGIVSIPLAAAGFDLYMLDLFPSDLLSNFGEFREQGLGAVLKRFGKGYLPAELMGKLLNGATPSARENLKVVQADMEGHIPFQDETFDYVLSVEGIEHTDAQFALIKELRRVLRPGGKLIMSTPNRLSLRSRLAYALTGQRTFKSFIDERTEQHGRSPDGKRIYHGHVFLVDYYQLRYYLHNSGFRIKRLFPFPGT